MGDFEIQWTIPEPKSEIRTVLFNWPVEGVKHRMYYKTQRNFQGLTAEDFGLRANDQDTHLPQFLMITKTAITAAEGAAYRSIFRGRSDIGRTKDKKRRNKNKSEKAALKAAQSKSSSGAAASSWE